MADVILVKLECQQSMIENRKAVPPFGLLYIADAIEKAGYSVKLLHEEGTEDFIAKLVETVLVEKPIWIGFSTMSGPTIYSTLKASKAIKRYCNIPIVWGGVHPTIVPEQTVANSCIDIVVSGEGEETSVELTDIFKLYGYNPEKLSQIKGIYFKNFKDIKFTGSRDFIKELDSYEPAWHLLDNFDQYIYSGDYFQNSNSGGDRIVAIITSRGCPWRCAYCYNQAVNKRMFRAHSVENIVKQIKGFRDKYNITGVRFWDDNIFSDQKRAVEILKAIDLPWMSSIRANELFSGGEPLLNNLKNSKCIELVMGVESGSQKVLNLMKKDIDLEQVRWAAKMCGKYKIILSVGFMTGIPGEDWKDTCDTLDFMSELLAMNEFIKIRGLAIYTPLPGTPMFEAAIRKGFIAPDSLEEWGKYEMGYMHKLPGYTDKRIKSMGYYFDLAYRKDINKIPFPFLVKALQNFAKFRIKHKFFYLQFDHFLPAYLRKTLQRFKLNHIVQIFYRR